MLPKKITMEAFGPYIESTEVDFNELGGAKLFVISGSTGSGKTSLLDAMSFALFGLATGRQRGFREMRSNRAREGQKTEVSFEFSIKDKKYKFVRTIIPQRRDPSKYNDPVVYAYENLNGEEILIANGAKEVDAKAKELLGFTHEQFSQLIVLPQGEFKKLLLANTKNKAEILSVLFDISHFKGMAELSYKKAKELEEKIKGFEEQKKGLLGGADADSIEHLFCIIKTREEEKLKEGEENSGKKSKYEKIDKEYTEATALKSKFNDLVTAQRNIDLLEALSEDFKRKEDEVKFIENIEAVYPYFKAFNDACEKENQTGKEVDILEEGIPALKIAAGKANAEYEQLEKLKNISDDEKTKITVSPEFENIQKLLIAYKRKKDGDKIVSERNELIAQIPGLKSKQENLCLKKGEIERKQELMIKCVNAENEEKQAKELFAKIKIELLQNQIYLISKDLTDGVPCPVCGSKSHPSPAKSGSNYTNFDLENQEKIYENKRNTVVDIRRKISNCDTAINGYNHRLKELFADGKAKFSTKEEIEECLKAVLELLRQAESYKREEVKLQKGLEKIVEEINQISTNISNRNTHVQLEFREKSVALDENKKLFDSIMKEKEKQKNNFLKKCKEKNLSPDILFERQYQPVSTIQTLKKEVQEYNDKCFHFKKQSEELAKELEGKQEPDVSDLKEKRKELYNTLEESNTRLGRIIQGMEYLQKIKEEIEKLDIKNGKMSQTYKTVKKLSDRFNGKVNPNIPLHIFALSIEMDEILEYANLHFDILTRKRYKLKRNEAKTKGAGADGLDILVEDKYIGTDRSVSTLSGGEMFLASLSLALGLAEKVQSDAGGMRMDAIFIDEGFGTLDDDTLDCAMRALDQIQGHGRMVGIISHVERLKERIAAKIEITRTEGKGAQIEVTGI